VDTNFKGTFFCCRAGVRVMRAQQFGAIVNVASAGGATAAPDMLAYRASKAAVIHLGRSLAFHVAPMGIRVHTLLMGSVESEGGDRVLDAMTRGMDAEAAQAVRDRRAAHVVEPEDIGRGVIALLANPTMEAGPNFTVV
jgi:3-oxoacyl-[acyl-carrier protein] reductase